MNRLINSIYHIASTKQIISLFINTIFISVEMLLIAAANRIKYCESFIVFDGSNDSNTGNLYSVLM